MTKASAIESTHQQLSSTECLAGVTSWLDSLSALLSLLEAWNFALLFAQNEPGLPGSRKKLKKYAHKCSPEAFEQTCG